MTDNMYNLEEKFSLIFSYMEISKEEARMDASFIKDFNFEELQFRALAFYLETYFEITIRNEDFTELLTIGSAMNFVRKKLDNN